MQSEFREGRDAKICIDDADASVVAAVLKYAYTSEYDGAQACAVLTACGQHIDPWNRVRDGGKKHFTHCMDSLFAKTPTYLVFMQHVWEWQLHRFRLHWQDKRKKQDVEVKKMDFNLLSVATRLRCRTRRGSYLESLLRNIKQAAGMCSRRDSKYVTRTSDVTLRPCW